MIKNLALTSAFIIVVILFNNYIKEGIFDARMAIMMARVELENEDSKEHLAEVLGRVGDGYRERVYTQVERVALEDLIAEIRSFQGKEMPEKTAETLGNRLLIITERHGL